MEKHGKLDEATAQYREAVRADPKLADARIDLGTALLAAGDLAGAKEHLQAATKLDPKLAQPHNYLGKVFMGEGNIPSAIAEFEEALRLHPDFPEAEENLRMAKASGERLPDAIAQVKNFMACSWASPTNAVATGSLWPVCVGSTFSQHLDGPQGRGYSCCDVGRFTITVAAVISNHRIGRLESVREADETVPG